MAEPKQNPHWTEGELMIALSVYFQILESGEKLSRHNPRIQKASQSLAHLGIHPMSKRNAKSRLPDGVRRRVGYFDKLQKGQTVKGHEVYRKVWERYQDDRDALERHVEEIQNGIFDSVLELHEDSTDALIKDLTDILDNRETDPRYSIRSRLHHVRQK